MDYNIFDLVNLRNDFRATVTSALGIYIGKRLKDYSSTQLSEFFGKEVYKNTSVWKNIISPLMEENEKTTFTIMSKRISSHLNFANKIYSDVAKNFRRKFSDEELRCIVQAIISYQTYEWKADYTIRQYLHYFIRYYGDQMYYLYDIQSYKSRISRTSLFEFELLMDIIVLLMEENKPEYIFKLVKTI